MAFEIILHEPVRDEGRQRSNYATNRSDWIWSLRVAVARAVLIVTNASDTTTDYLQAKLDERNVPYFRLNTELVPTEIKVEMRLGSAGSPLLRIVHRDAAIELEDIAAVMWRRPIPPKVPPTVPRAFAGFLTEETTAALGGLLRTHDRMWVNHPDLNTHAEHKPYQLWRAIQLGWRVPNTLITSDPSAALRFVAECPEVPVIKAIQIGYVKLEDGSSYSAYTRKLTEKDLSAPEAIEACPVLLQEPVPRRREIRVTVIGEQIFGTAIGYDAAVIDWRQLDRSLLTHESVDLPEEVRQRCFATVRSFGLHFGAFDLIETPSGEFVFLELNPNGQWAWLEMETEQPMREAFVALFQRAMT